MSETSKTGLLASPIKKFNRQGKMKSIQLEAIAKPAPYLLKPFAGLYNPYSHGCSLLCNHPADSEARELLKKAKDIWATEGRNLLINEESDAVQNVMGKLQINITDYGPAITNTFTASQVDNVPEELFRRYTETDSRPLTPAPSLISAHLRASGSRRCFTPDPVPTTEVREKTQLILDLRRSHSQETMSWHGSSQQDQFLLRPNTAVQLSSPNSSQRKTGRHTPHTVKSTKSDTTNPDTKTYLEVPKTVNAIPAGPKAQDGEEEPIKRRGRKKRKARDSSSGPLGFESIDPETQVATIGPESHNPSSRPSLVPAQQEDTNNDSSFNKKVTRNESLDIESYLDAEILKQLRRELNEETVDNEFHLKRRKALEEALKAVIPDKVDCEELVELQGALKIPKTKPEFLLSLPRVFSRSTARFELPMDSRTLSTMSPLEYVRDNISITSARKLLYNCVFNKYKISNEEEENRERNISGKDIVTALNEMMGKNLKDSQVVKIRSLLGWANEDSIDFKTFCGLCALCERLLAPEYYRQMPSKKEDPRHEIETADFESLARRLSGQTPDQRLEQILYAIKDA